MRPGTRPPAGHTFVAGFAVRVAATDHGAVRVPIPYTYSDMTGAGLDLVVNPPAG